MTQSKPLQLIDISYDVSKLTPAIGQQDFMVHLEVYKQQVNSYNKAQGDIPFNKAGAHLHGLYFENLRETRSNNRPISKSSHIIEMRYGSWDNFIQCYLDTVNKLQGSGWVFMNTAGYLNIIPNNRIVDNIAMIIDFWEHSYYLSYGNDRKSYAMNILNNINWEVVDMRILDSKKNKKHAE